MTNPTTKERSPLDIQPGNKGPRFVRVYHSVMDSPEYFKLSDGAKVFWLWLLRHCQKPRGGEWERGREYDWYTDELAEIAGISARSLQRYKAALVNAGLLETQKNHNPANGARWRDTYIVHEIPIPEEDRKLRKEEKPAPKMAKRKKDQTDRSGSLGGDKIGALTIDKSFSSNYPLNPTLLKKGKNKMTPEEFSTQYNQEIQYCKRKAAGFLSRELDAMLFKETEPEEFTPCPVLLEQWGAVCDALEDEIGRDDVQIWLRRVPPVELTETSTGGWCLELQTSQDEWIKTHYLHHLEQAVPAAFGLDSDDITFKFSAADTPCQWGPNTEESRKDAIDYLRQASQDIGAKLLKERRSMMPGKTPTEKGRIIEFAIWEEINEVYTLINLWELADCPTYLFSGSEKISFYSSLWGPDRGALFERLKLAGRSDLELPPPGDPV